MIMGHSNLPVLAMDFCSVELKIVIAVQRFVNYYHGADTVQTGNLIKNREA